MKTITFVAFGGTGDLSKRKLVLAFSRLIKSKLISKNSCFIGIGRSAFNDKSYKKMLVDFQSNKTNKDSVEKLNLKYFQGDVSAGLNGFDKVIKDAKQGQKSDVIFYLATSFNLFGKISAELKRLDLHCGKKGCTTKIVFEKPFGFDLESNISFEKEIHNVFHESQIFRIDHYLGKETVSNLNTLKFENPVFEAILCNKHVEKIEIIVDENLKMGKRINYYNGVGATKDMIQSHLLQVLSLLLMNRPKTITAGEIHKEKIKVLKSLKLKSAKHQLLGQYRSYASELNEFGLQNTNTDTFVKMKLKSSLKKWKGVDISLRTGKALPEKFGRILVTFKHESNMGCKANELEINIQPVQDVNLVVNVGRDSICESVKLNFCHSCRFGPNSSDGYEIMIGEIIKGDQTIFTSVEENKASWKILKSFDSIKDKIKFVIYEDGTNPEKLN